MAAVTARPSLAATSRLVAAVAARAASVEKQDFARGGRSAHDWRLRIPNEPEFGIVWLMEVTFSRTGERRYAIAVDRGRGPGPAHAGRAGVSRVAPARPGALRDRTAFRDCWRCLRPARRGRECGHVLHDSAPPSRSRRPAQRATWCTGPTGHCTIRKAHGCGPGRLARSPRQSLGVRRHRGRERCR
jgi:hypothetical protein